jgi:hypothetical protein
MSPNKHMQRAGTHKVLGRGRPSPVPCSAQRARVLTGQRAGADVGRSATFITVCVLVLTVTIGVSREAAATITLRQDPFVQTAEDRGALARFACSPVSAKDVKAWTVEDKPMNVFADVVCTPHRIDGGHPVSKYASCKKSDRSWSCDKGIEGVDFSLSSGRIVSLEIIDTTVGDVDRVLTELVALTLSNGASPTAQLSGAWVVWAEKTAKHTIGYSFAQNYGTRVFTLYRTCKTAERCSNRLLRHR